MPLYGRVGYGAIRARLRRWVLALEGGPGRSLGIREILRRHHGIEVGLHTVGPCAMVPQVFHRGTCFGRHTAVASTVRTFTRNHPMTTMSTHGFFYNPGLGRVKTAPIAFNRLEIGHGVSIGHNAIIVPPTARVGDGAVIAPGAVVFFNVPPYAVVEGHPARIVRYRYDKDTIARLNASRWWEKTPAELAQPGGERPELPS